MDHIVHHTKIEELFVLLSPKKTISRGVTRRYIFSYKLYIKLITIEVFLLVLVSSHHYLPTKRN